MTLKVNILLLIQKSWDAIIYALFKYLSTNKIWPAYNYLKAEHHNISSYLLPPDTHPKFSIAKENYEAF